MFVIGLTGGIGSGKTAASDYLEAKGITVVDADVTARQIVEPGQPANTQIRNHFGDSVFNPDDTLNRRALRDIVFADPVQRKVLEGITHPAIGAEIQRQLQQAIPPYALLVSPLLLETSQHQLANRILLIDAPQQTQVTRTRDRDQVPAEQVEAIIQAQMDRETRRSKADDVVVNDGTLSELHQQLDRLHTLYLTLAVGNGNP